MFANNAWAKLWKIEDKGNYTIVEMSTSRKNKETDAYETDFSSKFVRFVGAAHNKVKRCSDGDRVQIVNCGVDTSAYTAKDGTKKYANNFVVFDIALNNNSNSDNSCGYDGDNDEDLPL